MCGLTGFLELTPYRDASGLEQIVGAMAETLHHRGPDDGGVWVDPRAGLALGFRRLAVIDLSNAGHQPMISASGRSVMVFNGEVYNAEELRRELESGGMRFRGHSDSEAVLEACEAWGVEAAARRLIGMFAIAIWDAPRRQLHLIRDRVGIKPLIWGRSGGTIFFGSQPKSFRPHPDWRPEIDRDSLVSYLRLAYAPGHSSIFKGFSQVPPGGILTIDASEDPAHRGQAREQRYWDLAAVVRDGTADRFQGSLEEAAGALDELLRDAIRRRMVADVPLGAFLSGGIDSSTTVALMQAMSNRPVKTFSIGFAEQGFDEAPYAKAVAKHLGSDHSELYLPPERALELIPKLADWCDEPFADASMIPTFLISKLARSEVTVSLSGDGGDELFGGYTRYLFVGPMSRWLRRLPRTARAAAAAALDGVSPAAWERIAALAPNGIRPARVGARAHKLAALLRLGEPEQIYRQLVSHWPDPAMLCPGGREVIAPLWNGAGSPDLPDFAERMQYIDSQTYLTDDILVKLDRASMAVGLEARVPLLDHRVIEFAWRLPPRFKLQRRETKRVLRRVLERYLPRSLFERPKQGFELPLGSWLRGPLRDWAEDLLSAESLGADGLFDPAPVRACWQEHQEGRRDLNAPLWTVLMFQEWKRRWIDA